MRTRECCSSNLKLDGGLGTVRADRLQKSRHILYTRRMPWMDTDAKRQRQQFYRDYASGQWSMSELCDRFGISRPTGYQWVDRIEEEGLKAVADRSRAPERHPNRTPEHVEREILALREKYGWGATKLRQILGRRHPSWPVPARSTVNELLDRHGKLPEEPASTHLEAPGCSSSGDGWAQPGLAGRLQGPVQDG